MLNFIKCKFYQVPAPKLNDLENQLNQTLFRGYKVGVLLSSYLAGGLDGSKKWSIVDWFKSLVKTWIRRKVRLYILTDSRTIKPLSIIFTILYDRTDLKNQILKIASKYNKNNYVFACGFEGKNLGSNYINAVSYNEKILKKWRTSYKENKKKWGKTIRNWVLENSLPFYIASYLEQALQEQTLNLLLCEEEIKKINPSILVTEYDRGPISAPLVLACKKLSVPTITLIHGAAVMRSPSFGYFPIIADYICCWGDFFRKRSIEHHEPLSKIYMTGCHFQEELPMSTDLLISPDIRSHRILFASSEISEDHNVIRAFCEAVSLIKFALPVIRLHPSQDKKYFGKFSRNFYGIQIERSTDIKKEDSIDMSTIIVTDGSSFGCDAIFRRRAVIVFDPLLRSKANVSDLVENAGCFYTRTKEELIQSILSILKNQKKYSNYIARSDKFRSSFFCYTGDAALKNVTELIESKSLKY
jgi:hypothetical protein